MGGGCGSAGEECRCSSDLLKWAGVIDLRGSGTKIGDRLRGGSFST